jgi:transcription elongation factor Elf1
LRQIDRLLHILSALRQDIKHIKRYIKEHHKLTQDVYKEYKCPVCNDSKLFSILCGKDHPTLKQRYAHCKKCNSLILQQIINVDIIRKEEYDND